VELLYTATTYYTYKMATATMTSVSIWWQRSKTETFQWQRFTPSDIVTSPNVRILSYLLTYLRTCHTVDPDSGWKDHLYGQWNHGRVSSLSSSL